MRPESQLRRTLRISRIEGMFAELVGACSTGAVFTAWALHLGLSPLLIAALGVVPQAAQVVQLPAAHLTSRAGARRVAIWSISISRQALLPLALLPILPVSLAVKQAALLGVAMLVAVLGVIGNNAWTAWMGDLVPASLRGRYFGARAATTTLGATVASLAVGLGLDFGKRGNAPGLSLALLSLVACAAGACTSWLLCRQHDPALPPAAPPPGTLAALRPALAAEPRRLLWYQLAWSAAGGVALSFYTVHMLTNLRMGFLSIALYGAGLAAARMLTAPFWGRAVDRVGARPVLVVCSWGLVLPPLWWTLLRPDALWPLWFDALFSGALIAGQSLASFNLSLALGTRKERPFHLAAFCTAGGVATAAAGVAGGASLAHLSIAGRPGADLFVLFALSAVGRALSAVLATRIVEPRAMPVAKLFEPAVVAIRGAVGAEPAAEVR